MTDTTRNAADRATVLCELERYDEALSVLAPALAADPESPELQCIAAQAHLGKRDIERGLAHARRGAALDPTSEWPHRLMSLAELERENYPAAVRAAQEAVRLAPHVPETHIQLAYALLELPSGNPDARDAAAKALELAPDDPHAHLVAGAVAAAGKRKDEAEAEFNRVLALEPDNTAAHNELARLHLKKRNIGNPGGLGQAAAGFATAVAADPTNAVSRRNLELVLAGFLSLTAYLLFLDAWFVLRVAADSTSALARIVPIMVLGVPAFFVWRFVAHVPPHFRTRVLRLPFVAIRVKLAAALLAAALLAILVAALSPESIRPGLAGAAVVAAILGRVLLWMERSAKESAVA